MTRLMGEQGPLVALVTPTLEDMGFELVRVLLMGKQRKSLQVMVDRLDGEAVTVEDCEAISRALSAVLDVDDPIRGAYDLEVSSPGIDRPLTRRRDFERFAGMDIRLEADVAIDGRRRVKGRLKGVTDDNTVIVAVAEPGPDGSTEWHVPLEALTKAKLIMTDDLLRQVMKADKDTRKGRDGTETSGDDTPAAPES